MAKAFTKEIRRSITGSLGRFLAIGIIVALGAGFYAGLRMTAPDMKLAADIYYDGTDLYDIRVLSTLGLTDDDVAAIQEVDGVEAVMPAYQADMVTLIDGTQYTVRLHSLNIEAAQESDTGDGVHAVSSDSGYLNRPLLISGNWPSKSGECVLASDRVMDSPVSIGDKVEILEGTQDVDDVLKLKEFTVVGFVKSSFYSSPTSLGSTSLGSGYLQQYIYIPEGDFADDMPYTEIYATVQGAAEEMSASDEYQETVSTVEDRINAIAAAREQARYSQVKGDAQDELDEKKTEYEKEKADAEAQLADAKQQLDDAAATIASSEEELSSGQASYDSGVVELANQKQTADAGFARALNELNTKQAQVDAAATQLAAAQAQMQASWDTWNQQMAQWQAAWDALDPLDPYFDQKKDALEAVKADLDTAKAQLDAQQAVLDAQQAELQNAQAQLAAGWSSYYSRKQQAEAGFASAQATLDAAAAQLATGWAELASGKQEYEANLQAYNEKRAEADEQFAEAEQELADAQQKIDDIEMPTWYVMDRTKNVGAESFQSDADRVDQISQVFPFLFFLVAALVALTTMTRMVDEERMLIGTYKALGYSRNRITSKYLIYAFVASGVGATVGIIALSQVLPTVIFHAYSIMYDIPVGPTPIDIPLATLSAGIGIGVTLIATWGAATSTLRERPAALMLPRAPKPGKRILLERITPLWKRVSFSWKVTFRNIFRYKRRFIMTIIGIAGCTALLLTGLGLSDAINDIIAKQFGEINQYNTTIGLTDEVSEGDEEQIDAVLNNMDLVYSYTYAYEEHVTASSPDGEAEQGVYAVVPEDPQDFENFIVMRERVGHAPLELTDDTVIICEKTANTLELSTGDTIILTKEDVMGNATGEEYSFIVGGIMENYIGSYVYITPAYYTQVTGEELDYTTIVAKSTTDETGRKEISDTLLALDSVKTVTYNDESIESYQKMLTSVNSIVVVLVIAAAALAFVVLYNLTNINITERQREIATLKVLGFIPREVDAYIFRETMLLTVIGALVGLALGVFMERYVVVTAEVDYVMFGRDIHLASFAIAFALTLVFAIFVSLVMRRKLNRIDMVESLKSIE